jgi:hypothetical protein
MKTRDQLYQAKAKVGSYQVIARGIPSLNGNQVKAVFESEQPDQKHLKLVCAALGVDYETPTLGIVSKIDKKPKAEPSKPKAIEQLRKEISKVQGRDKKTLALAKGESCVECLINDGTIVSAHYNGFRQHELGQCLGGKCNDKASRFLCHKCHFENDSPKSKKSVEGSKRQLGNIIKTRLKKGAVEKDLLQIAELSIEKFDYLSEGYMFELVKVLINH